MEQRYSVGSALSRGLAAPFALRFKCSAGRALSQSERGPQAVRHTVSGDNACFCGGTRAGGSDAESVNPSMAQGTRHASTARVPTKAPASGEPGRHSIWNAAWKMGAEAVFEAVHGGATLPSAIRPPVLRPCLRACGMTAAKKKVES